MNPRKWWRWWRDLRHNPIYRRERGDWGKPNPFYTNLSRYTPFLVIGTIGLGVCAGFNPSLIAGLEEFDDLYLVWCLVCIPGMLLSMITIFASLMTPALTAPTVSMERHQGTWDMLRLTPYATETILLAKLFGGLARLRIWTLLFGLTCFQGLVTFLLVSAIGGNQAAWGIPLGFSAFARPWVEILFAAFTGMYASTWLRSATTAVAAAYTAVILFRLVNNSLFWIILTTIIEMKGDTSYLIGTLGPVIIYAIAIICLWQGIRHRAQKMSFNYE